MIDMVKNNNLLFIDDEKNVVSSLERLLRKENYRIFSAASACEGMDILNNNEIAVVVSDLMMPDMDGLSFFNNISGRHGHVVKILLTGKGTMESALEAINRLGLFGYLTKPWPVEEIKTILRRAFEHYNLAAENRYYQEMIREKNTELSRINEKLEKIVGKRTALLEDALCEGIMMLATAAEEKDKDTGEHLARIRKTSLMIGTALGLSQKKSKTISLFSVIHDVGKIHIPDNIINKPGPLDDDEWITMKSHTIAGDKILGKKKYYEIARQIARSHHENWDGTGYPDGLKGDDIPLPARIVAIADVFDALTNKRSYKEAWADQRAIEEMKRLSGKKFDPEILAVFLKLHENGKLTDLNG